MRIIRQREIVDDGWVHVATDEALPSSGDVIVPLARWQSEREELLARTTGRLGVRLPNDRPLAEIAADLPRLALVAIEFPKYRDGRGMSLARLLRQRHGFRGEIRAVGNVLRDQMAYLERCGFDAYELTPGKSLESALLAFDEIAVTYQGAIEPRSVSRLRGSAG